MLLTGKLACLLRIMLEQLDDLLRSQRLGADAAVNAGSTRLSDHRPRRSVSINATNAVALLVTVWVCGGRSGGR